MSKGASTAPSEPPPDMTKGASTAPSEPPPEQGSRRRRGRSNRPSYRPTHESIASPLVTSPHPSDLASFERRLRRRNLCFRGETVPSEPSGSPERRKGASAPLR